MAAEIIDGRAVALAILPELKERAAAMRERGVVPRLAVVSATDSEASAVYARSLRRKCLEAGVEFDERKCGADGLEREIAALAGDPLVHGIMIQTPLPEGVDPVGVRLAVPPEKDTDGCTPFNQGMLAYGRCLLPPCTAAGIVELIKSRGIRMRGARAVILGRSAVVGKPLAMMLLGMDAVVTVCHSASAAADAMATCREADILITATGRAGLVTGEWLKKGSVLIDAGISAGKDGRIAGDAVFEDALEVCSHVSPVPGGVGAVTASMAVRNALCSCEMLAGVR